MLFLVGTGWQRYFEQLPMTMPEHISTLDLLQDALEPTSCPGAPPGPPPTNQPCKNAGERCYDDWECCQGEGCGLE